jgi:hypothetical protein
MNASVRAPLLTARESVLEVARTQTATLALGAPSWQGEVLETQVQVLQGDSTRPETVERVREALGEWGQTHAQLVMLHPPYHDIIRFSEHPEDLSNAPDTASFLEWFTATARNAYDLLDEGRFACLIIGDKYAQGELIPLGFRCMQQMNDAGFITKAIVVKDIQGNERGKGRDGNLWRYRALAGGFYIFKHEYVIVFQKPAAPVDVRQEVHKVREMLPWGRMQDDEWDRLSRYVYRTETLHALRRRTRRWPRTARPPRRASAPRPGGTPVRPPLRPERSHSRRAGWDPWCRGPGQRA